MKLFRKEAKVSMNQIFLSHTKKDREFCDLLDTRIFARNAEIKGFRSEFEEIEKPEWKMIKDEINKSCALFFLVGPELVKGMSKLGSKELIKEINKSHISSSERKKLQGTDWHYTQNWIAYEIGVACQKGIDVWAICDESVEINFPMPYVNNYLIIFPEYKKDAFKYIRWIVGEYAKGQCFPIKKVCQDFRIERMKCIYCKMEFNFHKYFLVEEHIIDFFPEIKCPQCLEVITSTIVLP